MTTKKEIAFVSGCFDMLHSGHIQFLQQAADYGQLNVSLGSDVTIRALKGRYPRCRETERLFMVQSLRCVHQAFIATGNGQLDFEAELRSMRPEYFVVNQDGDCLSKRELCHELNITYRVLDRLPASGLPKRSTTLARSRSQVPYRIDLAGGWLDQPFVSKHVTGPVIVLSLEPSQEFHERSGMATSTRTTAKRIWGDQFPDLTAEETAKILFACENPPGKQDISGSQDALGIALPGVSRLEYADGYWPRRIESCLDPAVLTWLQEHLFLRWLGPRPREFNVFEEMRIDLDAVGYLSNASADCWRALMSRNLSHFASALLASFRAQVTMFPRAITPVVTSALGELQSSILGYKLAGAGGGGYLVVVAEKPPPGFETIVVRST